VLEVGDSLGVDLGWGLGTALEGSGHRFVGAAVGDTGLAEPWYYDWPAHLAQDLAAYHPAVVVVFLGANDVENLYVGGRLEVFGSPAWAKAYGRRVARMAGLVAATKARVLWVGMPVMSDPSFSADMATLNAVYRGEMARHGPLAAYFPSTALAGPGGRYEGSAPGPGGPQVLLRDPDGIHITGQGADLLGSKVVADLRRRAWL
jgi:hypothetical protein